MDLSIPLTDAELQEALSLPQHIENALLTARLTNRLVDEVLRLRKSIVDELMRERRSREAGDPNLTRAQVKNANKNLVRIDSIRTASNPISDAFRVQMDFTVESASLVNEPLRLAKIIEVGGFTTLGELAACLLSLSSDASEPADAPKEQDFAAELLAAERAYLLNRGWKEQQPQSAHHEPFWARAGRTSVCRATAITIQRNEDDYARSI